MAVPKLSDSAGANAVTFTRGETFAFDIDPWEANQDTEYTRDKYAIVRKNGSAKRRFVISVENETATVSTGVNLLFGSYVDWQMNTFRYYPDATAGTYRTVRLTKKSIVNRREKSPISSKRYTIVIECMEE